MDKKIEVSKIVIDGKEYIPLDSINKQEYSGQLKIVILQRGWVMIGKF